MAWDTEHHQVRAMLPSIPCVGTVCCVCLPSTCISVLSSLLCVCLCRCSSLVLTIRCGYSWFLLAVWQLVLSVDFCHGTSHRSRCFIPWIQCGKLTSVGLELMQVMESIPACGLFQEISLAPKTWCHVQKHCGRAVSSRALLALLKACKGHALHDSFNHYLFYWTSEISTKIPKAQNIDIFLQAFSQNKCRCKDDLYALFWISIFQFWQIWSTD